MTSASRPRRLRAFRSACSSVISREFTVFGRKDDGLIKILAGYHQYHAVLRAVASTLRALALTDRDRLPSWPPTAQANLREDPEAYGLPGVKDYQRGDRRIGVIWHTQGSGKSLLMAFYVGQLVRHPAMANPTIVVITDRNDLDDQLFGTFAMCQDLIRQSPQQADSRADLRAALQRASGGVIFTTIQKFAPEAGPDGTQGQIQALSDRRNIVVIADEAHRSQYGLQAKVDSKTGAAGYGFAKHLRDALPNASFIGFTGTPIEAADVNTPALFGHYIDIYDISRAVEDGATVPIFYESRLARIELPEDQKPVIDAELGELTDDADDDRIEENLKRKWSRIEALIGAEDRINHVAADIVEHFERRLEALDGKAMIVCMSRRICVALYQAIVALREDWHSDDEDAGAIKVVMTGSASDPEHWQPHIGNKPKRERLALRAKDPNDPLKLVIVRDMWLTGFDAPSLHTLYVDKPMRGHGLMQAIARVNRVFRDKPAGLVVDYIGIAQRLKEALGQYSPSDRERTGVDTAEAVAVMREKFEIVQAVFHGFDYQAALTGTANERLALMGQAIEWILTKQHEAAARESDDTAKKRAHRPLPHQRHQHRRSPARTDRHGQGPARRPGPRRSRRTQPRRARLLRRPRRERKRRRGHGQRRAQGHRPRTAGEAPRQRHRRLGPPRERPRQDARPGQAYPQEIRLPARPAGRRRADRVGAGRGVVKKLGGVSHFSSCCPIRPDPTRNGSQRARLRQFGRLSAMSTASPPARHACI